MHGPFELAAQQEPTLHMRIGIPGEIRQGETRVAATPETIRKLTQDGRHIVLVESGAGLGASILDGDFEAAAPRSPRPAQMSTRSLTSS